MSSTPVPHPIRVAAQLHPQHRWFADLRSAAVPADATGHDITYTRDHVHPRYGKKDGPHYECFTTMTSFAEATKHAEIGPLVGVTPFTLGCDGPKWEVEAGADWLA